MLRRLVFGLSLLAVLTCAPATLAAPVRTSILGRVTDFCTGQALDGVTITATPVTIGGGDPAVLSNGGGNYRLGGLVADTYDMTFTLDN